MRSCFEATFRTTDGEALFYRRWPAARARARGAILLLHRGHEHSGRLAYLADELDMPEFELFAWDARGHGRSRGSRPTTVAGLVADVQSFVDHVSRRYGFDPSSIAVVGQSLAAVLLAAWVHDYAPSIRAMVLAAPAFRVKLYVPFALPALRLAHALRGDFTVNSYVGASLLTSDRARIESFESDPLITRGVSVNVLLGLHALAERIVADAEAITVPTQVLVSGRDYVVDSRPQLEFYARLGARTKDLRIFEDFRHDTLGERDRAPALAAVREFLNARFAAPLERPSLLDADSYGFTHREADRIAEPLAPFSPRACYWALTRLALRLGGRFSAGLRLGAVTGFDSGQSLDYVYKNTATSKTHIGRWIDRVYLDAVGWQGVRSRKTHVEALIRDAVHRLSDEGKPVRIVDVAAGLGSYVLDAIRGLPPPAAIELRDYSSANVAAGSALIRERGLDGVASFVAADAFAAVEVAAARFTIGVVSGLYELYSDNGAVRCSLARLATELADGGYLVYTGQPWHPQLELIGRALTSHRGGAAWIMRRRTQAELDELVATAGFTKVAQLVDERGMFTVCLARKTASARSSVDAGRVREASA